MFVLALWKRMSMLWEVHTGCSGVILGPRIFNVLWNGSRKKQFFFCSHSFSVNLKLFQKHTAKSFHLLENNGLKGTGIRSKNLIFVGFCSKN